MRGNMRHLCELLWAALLGPFKQNRLSGQGFFICFMIMNPLFCSPSYADLCPFCQVRGFVSWLSGYFYLKGYPLYVRITIICPPLLFARSLSLWYPPLLCPYYPLFMIASSISFPLFYHMLALWWISQSHAHSCFGNDYCSYWLFFKSQKWVTEVYFIWGIIVFCESISNS